MAKANKIPKSKYKIARPFETAKKSYKVGDTIYLTEQGYKFLKSQKIVE